MADIASELQEAREVQAAMSAIMRAISRSSFELNPLLESIIESAMRLCRAKHGAIFRRDGEVYRWAAGRGLEPAYRDLEMHNVIRPGPETVVGRAAMSCKTVQIADAWNDAEYVPKDEARIGQVRAMVGVPLLREGIPIAVIAMARTEAEPFSDNEIALVTTFADQAAIAMENARLLNETRERSEELARERDAAEAANQAKSTFLATMSHEIRTPMNGVLGMMEVLERQGLNEEQRDTVGTMRESAIALLRIIDDVLDFSKIEAGRMELEETAFSLADLVTGAVQTLRPQAAAKRLKIGATIEPASDDALLGDPVRVRQILFNLLGNAVKFTEAGSVQVRAGTRPVGEGRQLVTLVVEDTGIGMDTAELARLFEPFSQADSSTTRRFGGTGLGLSIVRRLAQLMGGDVTARSEPGKGSVFNVTLQLQAAPAAVVEERVGMLTAAARIGGRILVVDDHPVNQQVLLRQLGLLGLEADTASDGIEALALWQPGRYAAVLADVHMPRMDGYGLTERIRALEADGNTPRTPIVAVTANAMRGEEERCLEAGMDGYLVKPVALARLSATLGRWIALAPQGAVSAAPAIDRAALRSWFGGDEAAIRALLEEFVTTARAGVREADAAVGAGDFVAVENAAHRLRGAALSVGARALGEAGERLEAAARDGDAEQCRAGIAVVVSELRRVDADR